MLLSFLRSFSAVIGVAALANGSLNVLTVIKLLCKELRLVN